METGCVSFVFFASSACAIHSCKSSFFSSATANCCCKYCSFSFKSCNCTSIFCSLASRNRFMSRSISLAMVSCVCRACCAKCTRIFSTTCCRTCPVRRASQARCSLSCSSSWRRRTSWRRSSASIRRCSARASCSRRVSSASRRRSRSACSWASAAATAAMASSSVMWTSAVAKLWELLFEVLEVALEWTEEDPLVLEVPGRFVKTGGSAEKTLDMATTNSTRLCVGNRHSCK